MENKKRKIEENKKRKTKTTKKMIFSVRTEGDSNFSHPMQLGELFGTVVSATEIHLSICRFSNVRVTYHSRTGFSWADIIGLARRQYLHFNNVYVDDENEDWQNEKLIDSSDIEEWQTQNGEDVGELYRGVLNEFSYDPDTNYVDMSLDT